MKNIPLIVIVGQTGVGKSRLAIDLALKYGGEIISGDSLSLRKYMDIGTAKPSLEDRLRVRHHLIDIIDPDEKFSASQFKDLAEAKIEEIGSRGCIPVLAGGSGLYVDSVLYGYEFRPVADPLYREMLESMDITDLLNLAAEKGLDIRQVDTKNKRRVVRYLETDGKRAARKGLRDNTIVLGLDFDSEALKKSIEDRVDWMIANDLEGEVRWLAEKYGWGAEGLNAVGYKQWKSYFEGTIGMPDVRANIISATNKLATKQRTWNRRNKDITWLTKPINLTQLHETITTKLSGLFPISH